MHGPGPRRGESFVTSSLAVWVTQVTGLFTPHPLLKSLGSFSQGTSNPSAMWLPWLSLPFTLGPGWQSPTADCAHMHTAARGPARLHGVGTGPHPGDPVPRESQASTRQDKHNTSVLHAWGLLELQDTSAPYGGGRGVRAGGGRVRGGAGSQAPAFSTSL